MISLKLNFDRVYLTILSILICIGVTISSTGCGTDIISTGVFLDSAVEGLIYHTSTQTGLTDVDGTFTYMEGETITFYMADIELGHALAEPEMTPIHLVPGATDETDSAVTNMARFLQTMDADHNPDNGITITEDMATAGMGLSIDFAMDPAQFEEHADVQALMHELNIMSDTDETWKMVSIEDAQAHLRETMIQMMEEVEHSAGPPGAGYYSPSGNEIEDPATVNMDHQVNIDESSNTPIEEHNPGAGYNTPSGGEEEDPQVANIDHQVNIGENSNTAVEDHYPGAGHSTVE